MGAGNKEVEWDLKFIECKRANKHYFVKGLHSPKENILFISTWP